MESTFHPLLPPRPRIDLTASARPPGGLDSRQVPQFVCLGFDDNALTGLPASGFDGGMTWLLDSLRHRTTTDGHPVRVSFYVKAGILATGEVGGTSPDPGPRSGNTTRSTSGASAGITTPASGSPKAGAGTRAIGPEDPALCRQVLQTALADGHELGSHTTTHPHGVDVDYDRHTKHPLLSQGDWEDEILRSLDLLATLGGSAGHSAFPHGSLFPGTLAHGAANRAATYSGTLDPTRSGTRQGAVPDNPLQKPGKHGAHVRADGSPVIRGFRTPYLQYNAATFKALQSLGIWYDTSIEEAWQPDSTGHNSPWPYTLALASPGERYTSEELYHIPSHSGGHPGLWELPISTHFAPPDELCGHYGISPGFRTRLEKACPYYDPAGAKLTGLDWNFWFEYLTDAAEFSALLKYTLDLRLESNRAPLIWGGHSDIYSPRYETVEMDDYQRRTCRATVTQRQEALLDFVDWARAKEGVRMVPMAELLDWMLGVTSGS